MEFHKLGLILVCLFFNIKWTGGQGKNQSPLIIIFSRDLCFYPVPLSTHNMINDETKIRPTRETPVIPARIFQHQTNPVKHP
jgi:hypothetical protein